MENKKKTIIIIFTVIVAAVAVLALLFYYQQQGLIKIFPTTQELEFNRQVKEALIIDQEKFKMADGVDQVMLQNKIDELIAQKDVVLSDTHNAVTWYKFAQMKEFLNDHQGAAQAWEISYNLKPNDFRTSSNLGNIYQYFIKDFEKAEFYYLKSLEVKIDMASAYHGLMDLYQFNMPEKSEKFEPLVLRAVANDSLNAAAYYVNLVDFFLSSKYYNLNKAQEYFSKTRDLDPERAALVIQNYPELNN